MAAARTGPGGEAAASSTPMSFQRKNPLGGGGARLVSIAGTRPSVRNGQLLVSSGLPALDQLLGGGLAVGTLLLIEEDKYHIYSHLLFKYFLAEGIVCGHTVLVASAEEDPEHILQELPDPLLEDSYKKELDEEAGGVNESLKDSADSMKIAWRYQNLPKMEVSPASTSRFGHYYDVSKRMSQKIIQSIKWHRFFLPEEIVSRSKVEPGSMIDGYNRLLQRIQKVIYEEGFDGSCPQKKNILRLGIQSLGSALWGDDICCTDSPEHTHSLTKFLYALRGLLRMSLSTCIITVPAHLIQNKAITARVINLSDTVVGLESFIGSERETNPLYKDYHGLIHIHQIPRLNSLICDVSGTKDLGFKLKRKLFTIERLHLPPDLSDTVSRSSKHDLAESAKPSSGCGAMTTGKKHLDF
ncbi:elongator complex protein 4 isoform X2 [Ornithorhynchus anatinus]|uniref:elongator complex protein 4 isoform X2 n=1 Tax=Ornithorhynchus anatinus TaxID=9258 RepID=UPI0010A8A2CC|nr:elongator complex protein 4 isoform X2 [Ornithorhynchus anatinus]